MPISFNSVPANSRVPFVYVEFDTSRAQQGPSVQPYQSLLIGQRLSGGSKPAGQLDRLTSESQARQYYGAGSMLHHMAKAYFQDNKVTPLFAIALDDDGGAVAAAGSVLFGGSSIEAGTLSLMLAGKRYRVSVAAGDTPAAICAAIVAEVQADAERQVDAAVNGGTPEQMDLTARQAGEAGNELDVRFNYFEGEELPVNLTAAITPFAGGSANPDISSAITAMGEEQFNVIAMPYTDAANLSALETELADRFGPIRQNDGVAFAAKHDTFSNLVAFGDGRNSPHVSVMGAAGPTTQWEWAANVMAQAGLNGQIDPARPFQTLPMNAVLAPSESERFSFSERDMLLKDGIATSKVDSGGLVRIERLITMYQENPQGAPDTAFLDVNTLLTLSKLRYDFRTRMQLKFPRHKLANDGTRFGPGQAIVTPRIAKAEAIALAREWEDLGLVEGIDQFKRDLIVERNASDPNRLDFLLPPDLVNQLRVVGAQIQFLL